MIQIVSALLLATSALPAEDTKPAPVKCEVGPVSKQFGGTDWTVYSCSDQASVVLISSKGNPASPFFFILQPKDGKYIVRGEGNGSKEASKAALDELSELTTDQIKALLNGTVQAEFTESKLREIWTGIDGKLDEESETWVEEYKKDELSLMEPTGPIPKNWPNVGVDIEAVMSKLPGGVAGNVLISEEGGMYFFGGGYKKLDETKWQLLYTGKRRSKLSKFQRGSFYSLTNTHLIYSGEISRKVGNAYCWDYSWPAKEVAKFYRRKDAPFDPNDPADVEIEKTVMTYARRGMVMGTPELCEVFFEAEEGTYTSTIFNTDGEPLEKWSNRKKRYKIVPRTNLRKLTTDFRN
ncbi:MAG: hypothetical protein ABJN65_11980 [Parasphingorhabdus sp.]